MVEKVRNEETVCTPILEYAQELVTRAQVSPRDITTRIRPIIGALVLSVVGLTVVAVVIRIGDIQSEAGRLSSGFAILFFLILALVSVIGMIVALWNAYVYEHARSIVTRHRVYDLEEGQFAFIGYVRELQERDPSLRPLLRSTYEARCRETTALQVLEDAFFVAPLEDGANGHGVEPVGN